MLHLLLVSIQMMIPKMTLFDSKQELISFKDQNNSKINLTSEKDPILCNHCKRTASNGVRCLGMCVADNESTEENKVIDEPKETVKIMDIPSSNTNASLVVSIDSSDDSKNDSI